MGQECCFCQTLRAEGAVQLKHNQPGEEQGFPLEDIIQEALDTLDS